MRGRERGREREYDAVWVSGVRVFEWDYWERLTERGKRGREMRGE